MGDDSEINTSISQQIKSRFAAMKGADVCEGLRLRAGTMADYGVLSGFHYLRNRPATATRVLVLEERRRTVSGRFLGRGAERAVVGVLVESLPSLGCALREVALAGRYRGWSRGDAARLINGEVRCISRVVVHPQWRGLGLAVRLVREALGTMTTAYTEALAAMGRVHPFFALAGMTEYRRWPLERDQRLRDALASCGVELWELASAARMLERVKASELLRRELGRWAGRGLSVEEQVGKARDQLLCEPVYYLKARAG